MRDEIIVEAEMIHKLKELDVTNAWVMMLYCKILSVSESTGYCTATNDILRICWRRHQEEYRIICLNLKRKGSLR